MRSPGDELNDLERQQLRRRLRTVEKSDGVEVEIDGHKLINFSSNDYLGLASSDPVDNLPGNDAAGSGSSRLVCGSHRAHRDFEEQLAGFKNTEAALTFSSGYACCLGVLQALLQKDDIVILDKLSHASLIDGARLSGAILRVFPHNDLDKLASHLDWASDKISADGRILVVTESIFSMDGDRAPLRDIVALKERHQALLLVDEAHAFGVIGPGGRGLAAELGIADRVDLHIGTLSKAAGLSGGFVAGPRAYIDLCVQRARSFIYSTAPPPALTAAASQRLDLIAGSTGEKLRRQLWTNLERLSADLGHATPTSAIVPIILGESERALTAAAQLFDQGFLIPAIRYPTVPRDRARLRLTVSAAHSEAQLRAIGAAIQALSV